MTPTPYELQCTRCEHTWIRRSGVLPKRCPRCGSPYWQQERETPQARAARLARARAAKAERRHALAGFGL